MTWIKYPSIPRVVNEARTLVRKNLWWTLKEDGSNISIWNNSKDIAISSRNLKTASTDLVSLVKSTSEYEKVINLIHDFPKFQCFTEACREGRSITGAKLYKKPSLFLFDIFNLKTLRFLPFDTVMELGWNYGIPVVGLFKITNHPNIKDLLKFRNYALDHCRAIDMEGMVVKTNPNKVIHPKYNPEFLPPVKAYVLAKAKIDILSQTVKKIARGEIIYPEIKENEVMGAIDKVWQDIGTEKFKDKRLAMPLVAKSVSEECKKHKCSLPSTKLYHFYLLYIERHLT